MINNTHLRKTNRKMDLLLPFARRFVAGTHIEQAVSAVQRLNKLGIMATLDILGENVENKEDAIRAADDYVGLLQSISENSIACNASLKLSQMGLAFDKELTLTNLRKILNKAKEKTNFVRIDMEDSSLTQSTLDVFWKLREEYDNVGIVIQSYLHRSEQDIEDLIQRGGSVRLCKGAYKEPASVAWRNMRDVRKNFVKLTTLLFEAVAEKKPVAPAIATHDDSLIQKVLSLVREMGISKDSFEFQMLYGIRRKLAARLAEQGYRVRAYVPYGTQWFPYFYRRLRERKENILFLISNLFKD